MAGIQQDGGVYVFVRLAEDAHRSLRLDYSLAWLGSRLDTRTYNVPVCDDGETVGWACYQAVTDGWRFALIDVTDERGRPVRLPWNEIWSLCSRPSMKALEDILDVWVMSQAVTAPFAEVYVPKQTKGDPHAN